MKYEYRYKDGDEETFFLDEPMTATALKTHNDRPCFRVITGGQGTVFKGLWNDNSHKYTRLGFTKNGTKELPL